MDELDPFNFAGMGTGSDPFNYYSTTNYSTNFAPTDYAPSGDAMVAPSSPSMVPGTSGAPSHTPSATPGGGQRHWHAKIVIRQSRRRAVSTARAAISSRRGLRRGAT